MVWVLLVIAAAALVRGTFGFGDALVAMPPLALLVGTGVAAPLVALVSIVIATVVLLQDWRHVHVRDARTLILSALAGIVLGMAFLEQGHERAVMGLLGVVVVLFALYSLLRPHLWELKTDRLSPLFGLVAGVFLGAYMMPGPALVIYGTMRRWSAQHFRATLQAFFLPTGIVVAVGHGISQRYTPEVLTYFAAVIPIALASIVIGRQLNSRFTVHTFLPVLHVLLLFLGAVLLAKAVWPSP